MVTDRGQAFTLEGFVASLLLLVALLVVLQSTAVTPLSSSTSNQHVESQQAAMAAGALDAAAENGSLRAAVLAWNDDAGQFHGVSAEGYHPMGGPAGAFGALVNRTFTGNGIAFNVNVRYVGADGQPRTERLVFMGTPTDTSTRAVETVTLTDDDVLYAADGSTTNTTLAASETYYAPDVSPGGPLYNVVDVEVVVWRM